VTYTHRTPCARCGVLRWKRTQEEEMCAACREMPKLLTPTWMRHAACTRDAFDPEWWWPNSRAVDDNTKLAMLICRSCKIRDLCLDFAIANGEPEGVWGGCTPSQRKFIAAERRRRQAV